MKRTLLTFVIATICMATMAVGPSGMYQYSVALTNYISTETGKAPTAYLWVPEKCKKVKAVYTDAKHTALSKDHGKKRPYIEVISGPVKKIDDTTFRIYPYEAGWDNPRRSLSVLLVAVGDADKDYRGCVQPLSIRLPEDIVNKVR